LTYAEYDPSSPLLALYQLTGALLPIFLIIMMAGAVIATREKRVAVLLGLQLANEVVNAVVKRIVKEPRPDGTKLTDYGWPSSHSQFMAFFVVSFLGVILKPRKDYGIFLKGLLTLLLCGLTAVVATSRIVGGFHTESQVVGGVCVGLACGVVLTFIANFCLKLRFVHRIMEVFTLRSTMDFEEGADYRVNALLHSAIKGEKGAVEELKAKHSEVADALLAALKGSKRD